MENPWASYSLKNETPKFHSLDLAHALAFNRLIAGNPNYVLADYLDPYPYTGNPDANVFVLLANPGISEPQKNPDFRMHTRFTERNLENLRHESADTFIS